MGMVEMTLEKMAATLAWHPTCNMQCRRGQHAAVVLIGVSTGALDEREIAMALSANLRETYGASYVAHREIDGAVEPPSEAITYAVTATGHFRGEIPQPEFPQRPFLVRWTYPVDLDEARRIVGMRDDGTLAPRADCH